VAPEHRPGPEVATDREEVASAKCSCAQLARVAHTHHLPAESSAVESAGCFDSRRDHGVRHRIDRKQAEYLVEVSVVENPHGFTAPERRADGGHAKRGYRPGAARDVCATGIIGAAETPGISVAQGREVTGRFRYAREGA
jgi:hypothetical protein